MIAIDHQRRIIHVNHVACEMTGSESDESIDKLLSGVISADVINDAIKQSLHSQSVIQSELKLNSPPRRFNLYTAALKGSDQKQLDGRCHCPT